LGGFFVHGLVDIARFGWIFGVPLHLGPRHAPKYGPYWRRFVYDRCQSNHMNTTYRSRQGFTLVEIMIVVVIIGLLAAMAIPAFQKVRQSSQDKAVLNNARQLAAAADQYFLENGVSTVAQTSLVGSTNYVKALNLVANETYPTGFTQGVTITVDAVAGPRTIT
jgi:type IV pilus assembly protein PilA